MPFARASELDRLFSCAGSLVLPREQDVEGVAAAWGTKVHSWVETGMIPEGRDGAAIQKRIIAANVSRAKLWPEEGEHELTMALDVVSGTVATCVVPAGAEPRDYKTAWKAAFDDRWVTGSLDFAMELLGRPWVDDLKTGRTVDWRSYAAQQSAYCLMYSMAKYGEVRDCRSTITHWPKYPIHSPPKRFGSDLSLDYLNDFLYRLRMLRDDVLRLQKSPTEVERSLSYGGHCRFCPSRNNCGTYKEKAGTSETGF